MGRYSYSQPSSSSADSVKSRDRKNQRYGIPRDCWCGGHLELSTHEDGLYQGRLYYKCARSEDGGLHLNKLWHGAINEEIHDLHSKLDQRDDLINYFTLEPNGTKVYPSMLAARIEHHGEEIAHLKQLIRDISDGYEELASNVHNLTPRNNHPSTPLTFGFKGFTIGFLFVLLLGILFFILKH